MAKKIYAVKKGFKTGIFDSWNECKKQIDGYSGAIYKSFATYEDAYKFLSMNFKHNVSEDHIHKNKLKSNIDEQFIGNAKAYVDGSYSDELKIYSFGVVILYNDKIMKFSGSGNDKDNLSMRNVAGELLGAMEAIKWAEQNKIKKISIYYDYEGIEKWALGLWKTNKNGTRYYKEFIDSMMKIMCIEFIKVKAHTGVNFNEEADRLAKTEINNIKSNCEIKKNNENTFEIKNGITDKYKSIFVEIMNTDMPKKTKSQCVTIFQGMYIDDEKMKKRKISEIEKIHTILNVDEKLVLIEIIDINKDSYNYKILL